MDFDVEGNLGAAERSVWSMERDGRPARAVTLSRSYATSVEDLWDAVTNGERIPRWFLTVGGELEPGGRYQLEGNAGGLVTACEPLSQFRGHMGVRRGSQLVGGPLFGRRCRRRPADPHAYPAGFGTLGRVRAGSGRRRLGVGFAGARDPSRAAGRADARPGRIRGFAGRAGVHQRQQRGVGSKRPSRSEPIPPPRVRGPGTRPHSTLAKGTRPPVARLPRLAKQVIECESTDN